MREWFLKVAEEEYGEFSDVYRAIRRTQISATSSDSISPNTEDSASSANAARRVSENPCPICFDNLNRPAANGNQTDEIFTLNCLHRFHTDCIHEWAAVKSQLCCPLCKKERNQNMGALAETNRRRQTPEAPVVNEEPRQCPSEWEGWVFENQRPVSSYFRPENAVQPYYDTDGAIIQVPGVSRQIRNTYSRPETRMRVAHSETGTSVRTSNPEATSASRGASSPTSNQ